MDKIHIRELRVRCAIGVTPEERRQRPHVLVSIELESDLSKGAATDRLEDTVDYKKLNRKVIDLVEDGEFNLVETLAERIAGLCLGQDGVEGVRVLVEKPGALRFTRSVGVEVVRRAEDRA